MTDKKDRLDILNKERFLDVISGEAPVDLGVVEGTYRNQPTEILVMVLEDPHELDNEEEIGVATIPLAVFLSEEDLSEIEIPDGADLEAITFTGEEEEEEEEKDDDILELLNFKPKGPAN